MCGIVGYVGSKDSIPVLLRGFTYYFRGLGTWRIIDKDVKLFNVKDEEE